MKQTDNKIRVLVVEPGKTPYVKEIESGLKSLQREVGGYIEAVYPFEDRVAIICNEDGKNEGLQLNRALYDDAGEVYDIIAGTFLIAGLTDENFGSLSEELIEKYSERLCCPETFVKVDGRITVLPRVVL